MMWTRHPRLLGLLIAMPALPATVFGVHWSLAPGATPDAVVEPAVPNVPAHVAAWLEEVSAEREAGSAPSAVPVAVVMEQALESMTIDEGLRVIDPGEGGEATRVGVFRDGEQMGWVEAAPGVLAGRSLEQAREIAELEARIARENEVRSRRFAEAAELAERNANRRATERQRVGREPSALAQIIRRTSTLMSRGPQFERPGFVKQIRREREQIRRASERRDACRDHGGSCSHR